MAADPCSGQTQNHAKSIAAAGGGLPDSEPASPPIASIWFWIVLAVAATRLISLSAYPLGDTTEARYAEVARQMVVTGNWITPQLEPGVPFWAKPPLSFWTQAASMHVFGVNEFGARFSSFAFAALICFLVASFLRGAEPDRPRVSAWIAVAVLSTMPLFYLIAGAVMTDMALVFFTTAAMTMFWLAVNHSEPKRWHGRAFFLALGGALLAKGLIGPVLIGTALCLFIAVSRNRTALIQQIVVRLSWIEGIALALLVALPWYVAAELRTPGFLQYFVVGEHLSRFIEPDWQGDRFGTAHPQPRGMIWVFFVKATVVWIPYAVYLVLQRWRAGSAPEGLESRSLSKYLFAWTIAPLVFFTLAGNTIESYTLPALPAMALLIARAVPTEVRWFPGLAGANAIAGAMLVSAMALVWLPQKKYSERRSTKAVIDAANATAAAPPGQLLAIRDLPDSAKFYSQGTAQLVSFERALEILAAPGEVFVMIREADVIISSNRAAWPEFFLQLDRVGTYGKYVLYRRTSNLR